MKLDDVFPGKYLKASEISEEGETFTISSVELEEVGQGADKQVKPVVYFEETDKGLVMNKTNFKSFAEVTGEGDSDGWPGHQVTLFATQVDFSGKSMEAIRVKKRVARTPAAAGKAASATAAAKRPAAAPAEPVAEAPDSGDIPF